MARITRLRSDESGFSLVFVGLGLMAFVSVSMLAIDVGMLMTARSQAQNSADAGALGGATALVFDNWDDRSASGPAVMNALTASRGNKVMAVTVAVAPVDVEFLPDPTGIQDRVKVTVYRDATHGNPVSTLIAQYFGIRTANIAAVATAEASPANEETCVLPFTVPDKWIEHSSGQGVADGPWSMSSTFDLYFTKGSNQNGGVPLPNPDVYIPPGQSTATGFNPSTDKGQEIVLKNNNQGKISPSMYNPWAPPGSTGGQDYRDNIGGCNSTLVAIGDFLTPETGNMTGPTSQGTQDLIAKDPNAYWDTGCNCVKGSAYGTSPRIRPVPLYNPTVYAKGQQSGKSQPQLQVTNYLGFFVEAVSGGGDVTGRIIPISGRLNSGLGPATGAFPRVIRLVQ